MKKVMGPSFGVRFYRRGVAKTAIRPDYKNDVAGVSQDNAYSETLYKAKAESIEIMQEIVQEKSFTPIHNEQEHTTPRAAVVSAKVEQPQPGVREKVLWAAAESGDCYAIRLLVMDGVDLDARDAQGRTAINIATQYRRTEALKTLLAAKEMRTMARLGELPNSVFFDKFRKSGNR